MKRKLPFIVVLALTILVSSTLAYAKPMNFQAHLDNETAATVTMATGQAIFQLDKDGGAVSYRLIVANIGNVTMAHIHVAPAPGQSGPPAVWLYPSNPPAALIPGRTQGTLMAGTFTAANFVGPLAGKPVSALLAAIAEGRAYVNVHTTAYPGGEIRGTIK